MIRKTTKALFIFLGFLAYALPLNAQEKRTGGMPPANVVVSDVKTGMVAEKSEFVGTVYYVEVSDVASEVNGKVKTVRFEEGQRVKKGSILVRLSSDLLEKQLVATRSSYEQILVELERAILDLRRVENLIKQGSVSEQLYDENRFKVKGLEKRAASLEADVERIEVELEKKRIRAPFDGVVIERTVDRGEWLSPGSKVATIAKDDLVDVVVDIPEGVIRFVREGMDLSVKAGGRLVKGKVFAIVPKGDVAIRTFPLKIRIKNSASLIEGMEARVDLPIAEKKKTLIVPRDAIITMFGRTVVFAVIEGKAKMIPVKVMGYEGKIAGAIATGLKEGMKVVVKGNERLRDGQSVSFAGNFGK
ncbi:MAG: efflux RND transporter periplasmic adaptor subunit [Deltaproteobacteria bacterium]|nr:MAG: efflux RND transporter periplasmic adaptor subunit [Deltaproteobacteria bacterium]